MVAAYPGSLHIKASIFTVAMQLMEVLRSCQRPCQRVSVLRSRRMQNTARRARARRRIGAIGKIRANISWAFIFFISSSLSRTTAACSGGSRSRKVSTTRTKSATQYADDERPHQANREIRRSCIEVFSRGPLQAVYTIFRWTSIDLFAGCGIRQVRSCRLPVSPSRYVCKRIHAPQRLLFGKLPAVTCAFIRHL